MVVSHAQDPNVDSVLDHGEGEGETQAVVRLQGQAAHNSPVFLSYSYIRTFCIRTFCTRTFCIRTFCIRPFRIRTFRIRTRIKNFPMELYMCLTVTSILNLHKVMSVQIIEVKQTRLYISHCPDMSGFLNLRVMKSQVFLILHLGVEGEDMRRK